MTEKELSTLKELITWAKTQNIAQLTYKSLSVTFYGSNLPPANISALVEQDKETKISQDELETWSS